LNGPEVLDSFEGAGAERAARLPEEAARPARRILVVDDSITTRTLEKSILEAEGYLVEVAVSGVDALDRLGRGEFDLVVSDVEMPQMNGLELVRQMRGGRHAALPVILMSSLAKDEDRARGLAAGANEYLVKSEFQQSRLLATLERLL
jgi:two-component system chemotaxis sensor kinase CheA